MNLWEGISESEDDIVEESEHDSNSDIVVSSDNETVLDTEGEYYHGLSIEHNVLLVRGMYAKFTTKLFAQSVENQLRSKELLWSKETACSNNTSIFKLMFIFFKETKGLIFVDFVKILIINLFN